MSTLHEQHPVKGYEHNDPSLKTGEGGLTVWDLQKMAQEKKYSELDKLFNNGLTMNALPVGLAAGAAARVFDVDSKLIADALDALTGKNWRGEGIFSSGKKKRAPRRKKNKKQLLVSRLTTH